MREGRLLALDNLFKSWDLEGCCLDLMHDGFVVCEAVRLLRVLWF